MQWNCRSIFHKLPEFNQYLYTLDELPDAICLQETQLTSKYQPTIPSYVIQRKDRPPHRGKAGRYSNLYQKFIEFLRNYNPVTSQRFVNNGYKNRTLFHHKRV